MILEIIDQCILNDGTKYEVVPILHDY